MSALTREAYRTMLDSIDEALTVCHESLEPTDEEQQALSADLREARDRLVILLDTPKSGRGHG